MKLTRMELDVNRRSTMKALNNPNLIHGALEASFEGERQHPLWRIDCLAGRYYLLVVSEDAPDLTGAVKQFGIWGETWQTRDYDAYLDRMQNGCRWRFRLVANPTHSVLRNGKSDGRGKVCAHVTPEHQLNWLKKQGEKWGFDLKADEYQVMSSQWQRFQKNGSRMVSLLSVTYEGMLTVTDEQRFVEAMKNGIGRGKAYGMGMMTVVTANG